MRAERASREDGFILIAVVMAGMVLAALSVVLLNEATAQNNQAQYQKRDDILVANAEAIIDRYAAKLTIDPQYYLHRVDESERARTCTDPSHAAYETEVTAGNEWIDGCGMWEYRTDPVEADWFVHPLLSGEEDVTTLIEVSPPSEGEAVRVSVVGRIADRGHYRAISAEISATSLSEFVRVTENTLSYGSNAVLTGKVYSGNDLRFAATGTVHQDIYAEGELIDDYNYDCPVFEDGSEAYDSHQSNCGAGDIREIFVEPLSFSSFWDDLERIRNVACGGDGICLDNDADAYLVHPYVDGSGNGKIAIWRSSSSNYPSRHCSSSSFESRWWYDDLHDSNSYWSRIYDGAGDWDYPANGTIWADGHVVLGNRGPYPNDGPTDSEVVISAGLTVLAGTTDSIKNLIVNGDVRYHDPDSFAVLGMIGSDEIIINPYAVAGTKGLNDGQSVHPDGTIQTTFYLRGAMLGQDGKWRIPNWCDDNDGSTIEFNWAGTPGPYHWSGYSDGVLVVEGSIATPSTGSVSGSFSPRVYGFDSRLEYLRPPFYPLIGDDWSYENWSEDNIPSWAKS